MPKTWLQQGQGALPLWGGRPEKMVVGSLDCLLVAAASAGSTQLFLAGLLLECPGLPLELEAVLSTMCLTPAASVHVPRRHFDASVPG